MNNGHGYCELTRFLATTFKKTLGEKELFS
jgi:hypothetical protein